MFNFWSNPSARSAATPLQKAVSEVRETEQRGYEVSTEDTSPSLLAALGLGGYSVGGVSVTQESAMSYAAVWACVQAIAQDISTLPLPLFEDTGSGAQKLYNHPATRLLNRRANSLQLAVEFRETMQATVLLWGNAYARIKWNTRMEPVALEYKHPRNTEVFKRDDDLWYRFEGDAKVYPSWEVLHLKGLSLDGITGMSVLHVHRETFGQGLAAKRASSSFYQNGARISGVLSTDNVLKEGTADRIRQQWNTLYGGADNAGKTAVLEQGLKYQAIGIPPADAQYLETAGLTLADASRIFRVPPHKIQDLSRSTNNNIEQQSLEYVQNTLQPWLVKWEQLLGDRLLSLRETARYFRHTLQALLRGDSTARGNYYAKMFSVGAMSPNQIMALEEMNPIEGGDRHFVQVNMMPLDKVDDILAAKTTDPAATTSDNEDDQ